jgi:hypothetical protein
MVGEAMRWVKETVKWRTLEDYCQHYRRGDL